MNKEDDGNIDKELNGWTAHILAFFTVLIFPFFVDDTDTTKNKPKN